MSVNIAKRWPDMLLVNPMNEAVTGNGVSALRRKEITKVAVRAASMRPMAMKFRMEHLTIRMSHDEERARGARLEQQPDRAPRHWLDPLVGPCAAHARGSVSSQVAV